MEVNNIFCECGHSHIFHEPISEEAYFDGKVQKVTIIATKYGKCMICECKELRRI